MATSETSVTLAEGLTCPHCGETRNILTERRPNGRSQCNECGAAGATAGFRPEKAGQQKIPGYRDLSVEELELVTDTKMLGNQIQEHLVRVEALLQALDYDKRSDVYRWLSIGKTDLQKGLMAVVRSITNPGGF